MAFPGLFNYWVVVVLMMIGFYVVMALGLALVVRIRNAYGTIEEEEIEEREGVLLLANFAVTVRSIPPLPALRLRISFFPAPENDPGHDEDGTNCNWQNCAD